MNLKRRLEALERILVSEPVTLFFEDGSSTQIHGHGDFVVKLVATACYGECSREMELIARSIRSEEPAGGHMIDLVRAVLNGPPDMRERTSAVSSAR